MEYQDFRTEDKKRLDQSAFAEALAGIADDYKEGLLLGDDLEAAALDAVEAYRRLKSMST